MAFHVRTEFWKRGETGAGVIDRSTFVIESVKAALARRDRGEDPFDGR